jgi:arylsulfatase
VSAWICGEYARAQHNSNTYHDWVIDRAFMFGPMQVVASSFLKTLKEYPPSQTPGDWSLSTLEKQIENMNVK